MQLIKMMKEIKPNNPELQKLLQIEPGNSHQSVNS